MIYIYKPLLLVYVLLHNQLFLVSINSINISNKLMNKLTLNTMSAEMHHS